MNGWMHHAKMSQWLSMQDPPLCPERDFLRRAAAQEIETVYRLWNEHAAAKRHGAGNFSELSGALDRAKAAERAAEVALNEHIRKHQCGF